MPRTGRPSGFRTSIHPQSGLAYRWRDDTIDVRVLSDALVSALLPLDEMDRCPEDVLNRILWRAMKGSRNPYPEWAIGAELDEDDEEVEGKSKK